MFEPQITHARELISRLERCEREGFEAIPASVPVGEAEYDAWYHGIERLILSAFGEHSTQIEGWRQLTLRRGDLAEQSIRNSRSGSAIPGYVAYDNACIAFLRELEAALAFTHHQETYATKRQSAGSEADSPPDSFAKAAFAVLWPSRPVARVAFVLLVALGAGAFAVWVSLPDVSKDAVLRRLAVGERPVDTSFGSPIPFQTGWIFIGYHDQAQNVFVEGPTAWVAFRPTGGDRGQIIPSVGDILRIRKDRRVVIADYRTSGLRHQLTSPPLVKDPMTPEDDTGIQLNAGTLVIVRDVETSGYPGRPSSIWARVASCDQQTDACKRARDESK